MKSGNVILALTSYTFHPWTIYPSVYEVTLSIKVLAECYLKTWSHYSRRRTVFVRQGTAGVLLAWD